MKGGGGSSSDITCSQGEKWVSIPRAALVADTEMANCKRSSHQHTVDSVQDWMYYCNSDSIL